MTIGEIKRFKGTFKVLVRAFEHDEIYVKVSKAALLRALGAEYGFDAGGKHNDTHVEACMAADITHPDDIGTETMLIG